MQFVKRRSSSGCQLVIAADNCHRIAAKSRISVRAPISWIKPSITNLNILDRSEEMAEKNTNRPQSEPEIIPPGKQPDSDVWTSETMRGTHRIYVRRVGPFEIILWVVIIGAILMAIGGLLLGFFLIAIPFMAALIIFGIVSAVVRGYFHRR